MPFSRFWLVGFLGPTQHNTHTHTHTHTHARTHTKMELKNEAPPLKVQPLLSSHAAPAWASFLAASAAWYAAATSAVTNCPFTRGRATARRRRDS